MCSDCTIASSFHPQSASVSGFLLDRGSTALLSQQEEKQFGAEQKSPERVKAGR